MRGFLMRRRRFRIPVSFHENKARRIVRLLKNIETCDARFLTAGPGIGKRRRAKRGNGIRIDSSREHGR